MKTILLSFSLLLLAGCASAPKAPIDSYDKASLGDESFLNVPVDITTFNKHKLKIYGEESGEGVITVFTDPATGKTYDLDGQPINEKGERVLKDGRVCVVVNIVGKRRFYGPAPLFVESEYDLSCKTSRLVKSMNRGQMMNMAGIAVLMTGGVAGLAAIPMNTAIDSIVEDDLL